MLNRVKIIVMFIQPTAHVRYIFSPRISPGVELTGFTGVSAISGKIKRVKYYTA